jgi:DNA-binding NarL/FixJ family response regulator
MSRRIRVTLADDHPIVLSGLRSLIQAQSDLELVGEASDGLLALELIKEQKPDVAVVDISMPDLNGLSVARRIAQVLPSVQIIALTLHEDRAYVKQAFDAGVRGYVLKRSAADNLVHAIRSVFDAGLYVDPAIAYRMFDDVPKRTGKSEIEIAADLTDRETEVVKLVALGFTSKEIARQLDLGVKTVETYKARAAEKLGLKSRAEIVRYAAAQGWLAG